MWLQSASGWAPFPSNTQPPPLNHHFHGAQGPGSLVYEVAERLQPTCQSLIGVFSAHTEIKSRSIMWLSPRRLHPLAMLDKLSQADLVLFLEILGSILLNDVFRVHDAF